MTNTVVPTNSPTDTPKMLPSPEAVVAAFGDAIAPGQPYEMTERQYGDATYPVFVNAPVSLRQLYEQAANDFGAQDLYVYDGERISYADALRQAAQVANALQARGIKPGDRVGIALRNYPEWIIAFMGITSCGAIAVALNAWWTGEEMAYGVSDSGLTLLFADAERIGRLRQAKVEVPVVSIRCEAANTTPWAEFISGQSSIMPPVDIAEEDNALILYTSGSTAHPKGVLSSHRGIIHALLGWESAAAIVGSLLPAPDASEPKPSMLLAVPLFHVAGLNVQLLSCFRAGRKLVGMYKWDPEEALKLIEAERITAFNGVPTMAWEVIQSPNFSKYDTSSLKSMGGGGAAMAPEHARQIEDKLSNGDAGTGYGMTETNGLGTTISGAALLQRPRSCGKGTPPVVKVKIIDDNGQALGVGESGEICIHGAMNFKGYWNNPEATASTLINGWVHTGDVGHLDEEGYVFITDRMKDMVIRGGENIGCQEVEAVIYDHPAVSECAVFGVPDERLGETIAAVVMPKPGHNVDVDDLKAHVMGQLAKFKVPEHVFIHTEQLPRIASGKIFKRELREQALIRLKLS